MAAPGEELELAILQNWDSHYGCPVEALLSWVSSLLWQALERRPRC